MGGTRYYDFLTGHDQSTAPTGSTPSGNDDFATVGYGNLHYARFIDTVSNLKAIAAASRTDQLPFFVKALKAWFYFDSASSATGDDENVITPTAGSGRWLRIPVTGLGDSSDVATTATIAALTSSVPVVRMTGSTATDIQGITAGITSQVLALFNASTAIVTLRHENASASAANRLKLPSSVALAIAPNGAAFLRYDKSSSRWVLMSSSGSGGGAGGSPISWVLDAEAPVYAFDPTNPIRKLLFDAGLGQKLYASIKVPAGYQAGSPINLRFLFTSADTTGNVLFQTVATLVRTGTDALTSTTNQRTSTNSALTQSAGTAGKPQAVTCDLSSTAGQINSVDIAAGDTILIAFTRLSSDTSTLVANLLQDSAEVTFS